jgi:hypothetical protein
MNNLFAIFFGFPSFVILAILAYIGIIGTAVNIYLAVKIKDYCYLILFSALTFFAAMLGWTIGSFI